MHAWGGCRRETYHVDGELAVGETAGGALREVDAVRRVVGLGKGWYVVVVAGVG